LAGCALYLITPPEIDLATFPDQLAAALDVGGVGCVQLRLPSVDADGFRRACDRLRPIAQQREIAFLVNSTPVMARQLGADGVHLKSVDEAKAARKLLSSEFSVGVSCRNNVHLALDAGDDGVDYVSFGPFFPSQSVASTELAEIDTLAWWHKVMTLPAVAVGGITAENCAPLVAAGADFLAVISSVWAHPDGAAAGMKAMIAAIEKAR
jgi:thiamine-phosphate pyrophosphorylase